MFNSSDKINYFLFFIVFCFLFSFGSGRFYEHSSYADETKSEEIKDVFFKHLNEKNMNVSLSEKDGKYTITVMDEEIFKNTMIHRVAGIGKDFVIIEDKTNFQTLIIPIYSIHSIRKIKSMNPQNLDFQINEK